MPIRKVASKVKSVAKKVVNKAMAPMRRQRAAAKMKEMDLMERHRKMQSGQMPYRY